MAMCLKGWISTDHPELRVVRYAITSQGSVHLRHLVDTVGQAEDDEIDQQNGPSDDTGNRRSRYGVVESPLIALARRKEKNGQHFLSPELVEAGERLREDFELAQIALPNFDRHAGFVTGEQPAEVQDNPPLARVALALPDLGPGLGHIALRCCCRLEGLEIAERSLGWSARSGKIVLRIALQRLKHHYDGQGRPLIG